MIQPSLTDEEREQLHASIARIADHFRAFAEALANAGKALAELQQSDYALAPPAPNPRTRPAWQSPYGPPQKGHHS